ncbi:MAG: hypothetical protein AB7P07_04725 [Hyphomonadaceae bacterium]
MSALPALAGGGIDGYTAPMGRVVLVSAFAAIAALTAPAAAQTAYFAAIPDLPLPPGFTETGADAPFEGAGRIIFAEALGEFAEAAAARDFIYETLPALGWAETVEDGAAVFQRGRERLHFFLIREGDRTRLRVQLVVQPAAMNAG